MAWKTLKKINIQMFSAKIFKIHKFSLLNSETCSCDFLSQSPVHSCILRIWPGFFFILSWKPVKLWNILCDAWHLILHG